MRFEFAKCWNADSPPTAKTAKASTQTPADGHQEAQQEEPAKIFEAYDALILEQHKHRPVLEFGTFDMALDEFHGKVHFHFGLAQVLRQNLFGHWRNRLDPV